MVCDQYKPQSYYPAVHARNGRDNPQLQAFPYLLHYINAQCH